MLALFLPLLLLSYSFFFFPLLLFSSSFFFFSSFPSSSSSSSSSSSFSSSSSSSSLGCGFTHQAVATECQANFLNVCVASIASKWFGEGEKYAQAIFTLASKIAPTVIFIDEVDGLLVRACVCVCGAFVCVAVCVGEWVVVVSVSDAWSAALT
jgi:hypothetical protein